MAIYKQSSQHQYTGIAISISLLKNKRINDFKEHPTIKYNKTPITVVYIKSLRANILLAFLL